MATNEPKRIKAGAPDYVVTKGETPLGYIEAKDIGVSLDKTEKSEQLGRYLDSLGNLILTDYLEFRWYVEGQHRLTAKLASVNGKGLVAEPTGAQDLTMLLQGFMNVTAPTIGSPEALAKKMAALAQQIRHTILQAFNAEDLTDDRPDPLPRPVQGVQRGADSGPHPGTVRGHVRPDHHLRHVRRPHESQLHPAL